MMTENILLVFDEWVVGVTDKVKAEKARSCFKAAEEEMKEGGALGLVFQVVVAQVGKGKDGEGEENGEEVNGVDRPVNGVGHVNGNGITNGNGKVNGHRIVNGDGHSDGEGAVNGAGKVNGVGAM